MNLLKIRIIRHFTDLVRQKKKKINQGDHAFFYKIRVG